MIRIRYILLFMFGVLAMLPVLVFGFWSSGHLTRAEFDTVESRHLLVAENLGLALDRYYRDLTVVFDTVGGSMLSGKVSISSLTLLSGMGFRDMCLIDRETGALAVHAMSALTRCTELLEQDRLAVLRDIARTDSTSISPVMQAGEDNLVYLVRRAEHQLIVGSVRTDYFQQLTSLISFGENGHAAIVDAKGNVLSHPRADWVAERKNLADLSIVGRMMNGETGVTRFYSPALETEMVAGFISVPETGWGIMVPQPVSELYAQAAFGQRTALTVLGASLLIAILISAFISFRIANPLERLILAVKDAREANKLSPVEVDARFMVPDEVVTLQDSYNEMVSTLNLSQSRIRQMAYSDTVTGLANREAFQQLVTQQIIRLEARGLGGVVILVDLDDFKSINDTLGHDWGDAALRGVAQRLSDAVTRVTGRTPHQRHPGDPESEADLFAPTVARVGGDEFTLFVPLLDEDIAPSAIVQAVCKSIAVPLAELVDGVPPTDIRGGGSVGAALFPDHGDGYEPLIKFADIAMYHAKRSGKNQYCVFTPEIGDVTAAELRRDVARGLAAGEFVLHYQPKISTRDDRAYSVEALVRWHHPERGLLMPGSFIPMIEEMDVMNDLGEWVLAEAARQAGEWETQGLQLKVAVNIATPHFGSDGFVQRAKAIIADSPVDASRIQLEITEETMLNSMQNIRSIIAALQDDGFEISLDDYGRGYSNLTRLANLTVNSVKIDGPLTRCVTTDQRTKVIVASTIDMAHGLGCLTVAEGVETLEQARMLRSMGCDVLQGYYFARPMPASELANWMNKRVRNAVHDAQRGLGLFVGNATGAAS